MTVLLLGYRSKKPGSIGEPLYIGSDAAAARDLQNAPPPGIVKTQLYSHLRPNRTRIHAQVPTAPEAAAPAPKTKPAKKSPPPSGAE